MKQNQNEYNTDNYEERHMFSRKNNFTFRCELCGYIFDENEGRYRTSLGDLCHADYIRYKFSKEILK